MKVKCVICGQIVRKRASKSGRAFPVQHNRPNDIQPCHGFYERAELVGEL